MSQRVLAPIHDGDLCERIVDKAASLTADGGQLMLAHVVDKTFLNQLPGASRVPDSTMDSMENLGRRLLEREAERVQGGGFEVVTRLRRGSLPEVILELIDEYEIETLVVGAHKRQFIEAHDEYHWDEVVEEAGVEIIVVPPAKD